MLITNRLSQKSYFIDNGMVRRVGFSFSDNLGHLLENLIFIELLRRGKEIYYHHKTTECDFVITEDKSVVSAIQVCYSFSSDKVKKREINGLLEALNTYNLPSGLIITDDTEEEIIIEDKTIQIMAAWKWLLE